jgi:hypothetical protein
VVTLSPPPERRGVTHWSSRLLAVALGVSHSTVARVWADHDLKPWQTATFTFSTDPELAAKVRDVVGLYLDPPAHAGQPSPRAAALHPDLRVLAEPGRGVLRHHRTSGAAPRRLRQRPGAGHRDPPVLRRLEPALPSVAWTKDADQILAKLDR